LVRSGQELIGGLGVLVVFVFTISLQGLVIVVPTECTARRWSAAVRGNHSVGIAINCRKIRGEPRCIACPETIAIRTGMRCIGNRAAPARLHAARLATNFARRSVNKRVAIRPGISRAAEGRRSTAWDTVHGKIRADDPGGCIRAYGKVLPGHGAVV
jgi:hypothetical protein